MTKDHKRMIKQSLKHMQREDDVNGKIAAFVAGLSTWIIWFAIFFA